VSGWTVVQPLTQACAALLVVGLLHGVPCGTSVYTLGRDYGRMPIRRAFDLGRSPRSFSSGVLPLRRARCAFDQHAACLWYSVLQHVSASRMPQFHRRPETSTVLEVATLHRHRPLSSRRSGRQQPARARSVAVGKLAIVWRRAMLPRRKKFACYVGLLGKWWAWLIEGGVPWHTPQVSRFRPGPFSAQSRVWRAMLC